MDRQMLTDIEERVRSLEMTNSAIAAKLDIIARLLEKHMQNEEAYLRTMIITMLAGSVSIGLFILNTFIGK